LEEQALRIAIHGAVALGLLGGASLARADLELAQKKNCLACHTVDKRKYGPNFQQVAAKYADQKNAAELLARKIRRGGTGVWGQDIMPPQPQVSQAEALVLAKFVLSVK
jgi:cytochrome c